MLLIVHQDDNSSAANFAYSELSENTDDEPDQECNTPFTPQSFNVPMDSSADEPSTATKKEEFDQSEEDFFDSKSSAPDEIYLNRDESGYQNENLVLHKNINLNEMRSSLKEINDQYRQVIGGGHKQHSYIHKKGKAPQPPLSQQLQAKNEGNVSAYTFKETEI